MFALSLKTTFVSCALLFIKQLNCSRFGGGGQYKRYFCGDCLAVCDCVLFIITFWRWQRALRWLACARICSDDLLVQGCAVDT